MAVNRKKSNRPDDFDEEELHSENFSTEPVEPDAFDPEAKFPRDIDAAYDSDDDLTEDDIDRILGQSVARRNRIIAAAIVIALLCLWFFKWGGREIVFGGFQKDPTAVAALADTLDERILDSLRSAADRYIVEMERARSIPAAELPVDLQPHAIGDDTLADYEDRPDLGMVFETVTPQSLAPKESARFPTLRSIMGTFTEQELTDNLPGPSMGEFEWMLRIDLAREELVDTLPDMADEEFYKMLYMPLAESDTTVIEDEDDLAKILLRSLDDISPEIAEEPDVAAVAASVEVRDTIVVVDPRMKAANDSLAKILTNLQRALDLAHRDISGMKLEISSRDKQVIRQQDSIRAVEVRRFARIIEKMDPNEAVKRLDGRSTEELIELLFLLKQRDAAKIIQALPPEKGMEVATRIFNQ